MFRLEDGESDKEHAGVDSGVQVGLVVVREVVVSPPEGEGSAGTQKHLGSEAEVDGVVELRGSDNGHLPVEVNESQASAKEGLDFFGAKVRLEANGGRSDSINCASRVNQELAIDNEFLRRLNFECDGHNFRRIFQSDGTSGEQSARVLQVQKKELAIFRGTFEDEGKGRVAGPGAKLVRAAWEWKG